MSETVKRAEGSDGEAGTVTKSPLAVASRSSGRARGRKGGTTEHTRAGVAFPR